MSDNGKNNRLEEAMALLIHNQVALGQHLTALSQQQTAFLARMAETDVRIAKIEERIDERFRSVDERFIRIEERLSRIESILEDLPEVIDALHRLPDVLGKKFGFQPPQNQANESWLFFGFSAVEISTIQITRKPSLLICHPFPLFQSPRTITHSG
jgi:hypothetical protein